LVVVGDRPTLPDPIPGEPEFSWVSKEADHGVRIVGYSVLNDGQSVRVAALDSADRAAAALRRVVKLSGIDAEVVRSDLPEAFDAVTGDRFAVERPPPSPTDAGRPRWLARDWFAAPPTTTAHATLLRTKSEPNHARALAELWFAVEHQVEEGNSGVPVVRALAVAAAAIIPEAVRSDLEVVLSLSDTGLCPPAKWAELRDWQPEVSCPWVESHIHRMRQSLGPELRKDVVAAATRAAWVLTAVYAVRNRVAHEGWSGSPEEQGALARLRASAECLVSGLLDRSPPGTPPAWDDLALRVDVLLRTGKPARGEGPKTAVEDVAAILDIWSPPRQDDGGAAANWCRPGS
jgi:hypothetical protein